MFFASHAFSPTSLRRVAASSRTNMAKVDPSGAAQPINVGQSARRPETAAVIGNDFNRRLRQTKFLDLGLPNQKTLLVVYCINIVV